MAQPPRRSAPPGRPTFNYIEPSFDDVQKILSGGGSGFPSTVTGVGMYNGRAGENAVRILPSNWNSKHFAYEVYEHRFVGSPQGNYLCLQHMKRQRCPICEDALNIKRSGDVEGAKKVEAKWRWYCYVLDRDGPNPHKPLIWDMDYVKHKEVLAQTQESRSKQVIPVARLDRGHDLTFIKTGSGLGTRYVGFKFEHAPSPIADDPATFDAIVTFINEHPIPDILKFCTTEELDQAMSGTMAEADTELEAVEEEAPPRRAARQLVQDEIEEEVVEEEVVDEEVAEEVDEEEVDEEVAEEVDEEVVEEAPEPVVRQVRRTLPAQQTQPAPRQRLVAGNGGQSTVPPRRTVTATTRPTSKPATRRYPE